MFAIDVKALPARPDYSRTDCTLRVLAAIPNHLK